MCHGKNITLLSITGGNGGIEVFDNTQPVISFNCIMSLYIPLSDTEFVKNVSSKNCMLRLILPKNSKHQGKENRNKSFVCVNVYPH